MCGGREGWREKCREKKVKAGEEEWDEEGDGEGEGDRDRQLHLECPLPKTSSMERGSSLGSPDFGGGALGPSGSQTSRLNSDCCGWFQMQLRMGYCLESKLKGQLPPCPPGLAGQDGVEDRMVPSGGEVHPVGK